MYPNNTSPPFRLQPIQLEEVLQLIRTLNRHKASDIFDIKPAVLKANADFMAPHLTRLYNKAIAENQYPDSIKITKVIEIYKKDKRTLPKNYRPISLLPIIAKVLDTIINRQLMKHLLLHKLLSPTQYAFRPNSSCTMTLETVLDRIHRHRSRRKPTLAIYVDLSKAYDTISHDKLIHKLQQLLSEYHSLLQILLPEQTTVNTHTAR